MYIYIYIYIHICMYIYLFIYRVNPNALFPNVNTLVQDNATALEYFQKGAALGHAPSQNGLGFMCDIYIYYTDRYISILILLTRAPSQNGLGVLCDIYIYL